MFYYSIYISLKIYPPDIYQVSYVHHFELILMDEAYILNKENTLISYLSFKHILYHPEAVSM